MVVNRGGLLAGVATAALGRLEGFGGFIAPGICSIEAEGGEGAGGGGAGGGAGGAAAAEEEDFFGGTGAGSGGEQGGEGAGGAEGGKDGEQGGAGDAGKGEGAIAEWMKSFSGDKKEGELSNQEWLAKVGVKDLDSLAQIARENQKALRESGRVKVPGEGATEAEIKAYREAVGAPEAADGYKVELPQGVENYELDAAFLDPMKAIALKHNIPAAAFKDLGDAFLAAQLESVQSEAAGHNAARDATLKAWGPEAEQGKEEFRRGLDVLGVKTADVKQIQAGYGAKATMELFRKIGQMAGEDFFAGNGSRPSERFGVSNAADAQKAIDGMIGDKETVAKIRAKDPVTVTRYNRLTEALAHFRERDSKAR